MQPEAGVYPLELALKITVVQFPYADDEPGHDGACKRVTKSIHEERQVEIRYLDRINDVVQQVASSGKTVE